MAAKTRVAPILVIGRLIITPCRHVGHETRKDCICKKENPDTILYENYIFTFTYYYNYYYYLLVQD